MNLLEFINEIYELDYISIDGQTAMGDAIHIPETKLGHVSYYQGSVDLYFENDFTLHLKQNSIMSISYDSKDESYHILKNNGDSLIFNC